MTITRVGTDTTSQTPLNNNNTSLAISHTSAPVENDYAFIEATIIAVGTGTSNDFSLPSGWTLMGTAFDSGTPSHRHSVFYKKWASGDSWPTLTWPNPAQGVAIAKIRRGVDGTNPIHQSSVNVHAGTGTARTTATITTTIDTVIEYDFSDRSGSTFTKGTSTDDSLASVKLTSSSSLASFAIPGVSSANSYVRTATASVSTSIGASAIYALKPAAGTPPTVSLGSDFSVNSDLVSTFDLTATASDSDGTIVSYVFEDVTGTPTTIPGSGASRTITFTKPNAGETRTYRCTVTDNDGLTAYDEVVVTISATTITSLAAFRAAANNKNTSTTPSVTVPNTVQTNDYVLVTLSENNTDVITVEPSQISRQNLDSSTATFPNLFYVGRVGQSGLAANTVLSWTLSVSRQWSANLYVASGIDTVNAIIGTLQVAHSSTVQSNMTAPSITVPSGETAWLVECVSGKSNGTAITAWTPPTGWTNRQTVQSNTTFGGSSAFADRDAGAVGPGTYGGETYTPNQQSGASVRYIIALRPAGNAAPIVSLGDDVTVDPNLVDTFTLTATASDPDGTIASYVFEDITGTYTTISGSGNTRTINVDRSTSGSTRTYRCTVTDDDGLTSSDTIVVTFLPHTRWRKTASSLVALRRR